MPTTPHFACAPRMSHKKIKKKKKKALNCGSKPTRIWLLKKGKKKTKTKLADGVVGFECNDSNF